MRNLEKTILSCFFLSVMNLMSMSGQADDRKTELGRLEKVYIQELDITYQAKIDTGAESASLNAINVEFDGNKKDKDRKVTFDLVLPGGKTHKVIMPLYDTVRIKKRADAVNGDDGDGYSERASLQLTLCIGKIARKIEVNLADRRRFSTDMLLGSKGIVKFGARVDPEKDFVQGNPGCEASQTVGD